jgi:hypothetical protein
MEKDNALAPHLVSRVVGADESSSLRAQCCAYGLTVFEQEHKN